MEIFKGLSLSYRVMGIRLLSHTAIKQAWVCFVKLNDNGEIEHEDGIHFIRKIPVSERIEEAMAVRDEMESKNHPNGYKWIVVQEEYTKRIITRNIR